jgi:hypothetical protein
MPMYSGVMTPLVVLTSNSVPWPAATSPALPP